MPKVLRIPFYRMIATLGVFLGLGLWQFDFVFTAINSNVVLNATIFGTFAFGVMLTVRNVLMLKNEVIAFDAIKEAHNDVQNEDRDEINDPLWRHYRCLELGVVFARPDVLNQAYHLILEQLSRGKALTISPATMQTIIEGIDIRLDDRRSLTQYVSGILVLLGLIGTFLGLMVTLASVGDILGQMDLSGGDPTAMIQNLIGNLQIPLQGMATGFSSSLFGLLTSLTLGIMIRFGSMAAGAFRLDFEAWMTNVVQIDGEESEAGEDGFRKTMLMDQKRLRITMQAARFTVASNAKLAENMKWVTETLAMMNEDMLMNKEVLHSMTESMKELHETNQIVSKTMATTSETVNEAAHVLNLRQELKDTTAELASQLEMRDTALAKTIESLNDQLDAIEHQGPVPNAVSEEKSPYNAYALMEDLREAIKMEDFDTFFQRLKTEGLFDESKIGDEEDLADIEKFIEQQNEVDAAEQAINRSF